MRLLNILSSYDSWQTNYSLRVYVREQFLFFAEDGTAKIGLQHPELVQIYIALCRNVQHKSALWV